MFKGKMLKLEKCLIFLNSLLRQTSFYHVLLSVAAEWSYQTAAHSQLIIGDNILKSTKSSEIQPPSDPPSTVKQTCFMQEK